MISSLYIDSTDGLRIGLLNDQLDFVKTIEIQEKKNSRFFQKSIYDLLSENKLKLCDCSGIFLANGPGSYTGLRLGEGFAQIAELNAIPVYSFYHFEVPYAVGFKAGVYYHSAFKGEWLKYEWENDKKENKLVKEISIQNQGPVFFSSSFHQEDVVDKVYFTNDLIKQNSKLLFTNIKENKIRKPIYYFRAAENEFKTIDQQGKRN